MSEQEFDFAFSFAGEQRGYVERTVRACQHLGLRVFYDKDHNNEWWGQNFIREQRSVYSSKARYFVPFISTEYLAKPIPMDEFSAAMMTAVKYGDGYVLPVLIDNAEVPADLMHPHIHYLRAQDFTPEELATELARKLGVAVEQGQEPAELGAVVEQALQFRMPKIVPSDWSKYAELDKVFEILTARFKQGAAQLRQEGLIANVRVREDELVIRVERGGETVAGIDVRRGGGFGGDDQIVWSLGWRNHGANSFNGWATPKFDKDRGRAIIDISDFNSTLHGEPNAGSSYDEFFQHLWELLIEQIEQL
jgi:hypothetical protein